DIRQVARVTLGLPSQLRLTLSIFFFPHPAFTPQRRGIFKRALSPIAALLCERMEIFPGAPAFFW
ncbi:hypothetical protein, partial [Ralstonia pseudosolanacearum]|uniref:hypothetical protein n=1 Tax=Ralstonia pseudosolanacearum TaxID=1310165 RepID=UPI0020040CED